MVSELTVECHPKPQNTYPCHLHVDALCLNNFLKDYQIYMYVVEMFSGVWIGDSHSLSCNAFLQDNEIGVIYNCTDIYEFPERDAIKVRLPFSSSRGTSNIDILQQHHKSLTSHIHKHIDSHNILIACCDGLTISPLIVAIYILHYGNMDPKSITHMLQSKDSQLSLWCDLTCFM